MTSARRPNWTKLRPNSRTVSNVSSPLPLRGSAGVEMCAARLQPAKKTTINVMTQKAETMRSMTLNLCGMSCSATYTS